MTKPITIIDDPHVPKPAVNTRLAVALAMTVAMAQQLQSSRDVFLFDPPKPVDPTGGLNRKTRRKIRANILKTHR